MSGKKNKKSTNAPYIPLAPISKLIAETFYMNNYEINLIFEKFLELWSRDADIPYIRVPLLVSTFKLYNYGIVDKFFHDGCVYANQFFQFVCSILFFNFHQMNLLILSECKIHSNYIITHEQIMDFMDAFDKDHDCDLTVFFHDYVIDIPDTKKLTYSLKAFTSFINENKLLETNFHKVKSTIYKEIFPKENVEKIFKRYEFYNNKINNNNSNNNRSSDSSIVVVPKESCFARMKRRLSHEPPPYHFDYCINKNRSEYANTENYIDVLVYMMKQEYGYGYRSSKPKINIERSYSSINRSISNVNNNTNNNNVIRNNSTSKMNNSVKNNNILLRNSQSLSLKERLNENKSRFDTRSRSFLTATIKSNNLNRSLSKLETNK